MGIVGSGVAAKRGVVVLEGEVFSPDVQIHSPNPSGGFELLPVVSRELRILAFRPDAITGVAAVVSASCRQITSDEN